MPLSGSAVYHRPAIIVFTRNLLDLARSVYLGRTSTALARIESLGVAGQIRVVSLVGALIGLSLYLNLPRFSFLWLFYDLVGGVIALTGICLIGASTYSWLTGTFGRRRELRGIFFGSSVFLLPAGVPLIGPILLPALIVGWFFVLARLLARKTEKAPGYALMQIVIPPVIAGAGLLVAFQIVGWMLASQNVLGPRDFVR